MKKFAFLFALSLTPFISAKTVPSPNAFGISAEWLYFNIGMDDPFIAADSPNNTFNFMGRHYANSPTWHSGVRLELLYRLCDDTSSLRLRSAYFPEFSNNKIVNANVTAEAGVIQNILFSRLEAEATYNFCNVEFLYDRDIYVCGPFDFSLQGGLQFLFLHLRDTRLGFSGVTTDFNKFQIDRKGIGPEIGAELGYIFCPSLSLQMRGTAALLVAHRQVQWQETVPIFTPPTIFLKDDTFWTLIPSADIRLGLNFSKAFSSCLCNGHFNLEAGYEVLYYSQPFSEFNAFLNKEFHSNFIGHGPYVQLGLAF